MIRPGCVLNLISFPHVYMICIPIKNRYHDDDDDVTSSISCRYIYFILFIISWHEKEEKSRSRIRIKIVKESAWLSDMMKMNFLAFCKHSVDEILKRITPNWQNYTCLIIILYHNLILDQNADSARREWIKDTCTRDITRPTRKPCNKKRKCYI